ncbi:MAG: hypothetical protein E7617_03830 [Ruminococcaceae bacterium]|nr:hypothetical protein [Oscillospiraceae bacterium]
MKKIISLTLITVICCTFLFSCGKTEDAAKLYLVKQTMADKTGTVTVEFIYNQDYQVVKNKTTSGGISDTESDIGYDENGYQNYQKNISKSGLVSEIFITNDANGRILEMRTVSIYNGKETETIITYEYTDENGSRIETATSGTVTTVTNDEHGNAIARSNNRGQSSMYENKYEGELLIETKATMTVGTNTIVTTTKYDYDSQGNKVKETNYDSNGTVISTQTFEYSSKVTFVD